VWLYIKNRYKLFIALYLFWILLHLSFDVKTLLLGLLVSGFVTVMSYAALKTEFGLKKLPVDIKHMIFYLITLIVEIYKSGFMYIGSLLFKHLEPVVFSVILDVKDPVVLSIIANSITLTPGTISIEVDAKYNMITVMTLAKKGTSLKELETPIHDKVNRLVKRRGLHDYE
jgi:multicomponent Na+:H+ antiporter subunit E